MDEDYLPGPHYRKPYSIPVVSNVAGTRITGVQNRTGQGRRGVSRDGTSQNNRRFERRNPDQQNDNRNDYNPRSRSDRYLSGTLQNDWTSERRNPDLRNDNRNDYNPRSRSDRYLSGNFQNDWTSERRNPDLQNDNRVDFNPRSHPGFSNHRSRPGFSNPRSRPDFSNRGDGRRPRMNANPNSRRPHKMKSFQYVEGLANREDVQEVILELFREKAGFIELLDNKDMTNDMVILLVRLLCNICNTNFNNAKVNVLTRALRSHFMEKLTVYLTLIVSQNAKDKFGNKYFWDDPNQFWTGLIKFIKTTYELIPTYCETVQKLLKTMTVLFPLIESTHSIEISEEIKSQAASLLDLIEKTVQNIEVKRRRVDHTPMEEDEEPPNDFRDIEIIPSAQEVITKNSPFLRRNIVDRAFSSIEHYLDIQFRLLREDFVAPLRRGITTYLDNNAKPKKDRAKIDDIKVYDPIKFVCVEVLNECNCYRIRFDFSKKKKSFVNENSKRFMFGSLICFTRDNFKSLLFGKIVQRDVKLLEQGLLVVGFMEEVQVDFEADYLMIESRVYFEPYYHVLNVLQRMDIYNFPMEKYIIKVEPDAHPPQYLLQEEPVFYKVESTRFWALNFPNKTFYNLNESQQNAFQAALTDEFSIIQGPPGTGKTYLGLRIAQTLLENAHVWYKKTPMLIICYTNHALDQFLEGIIPVTDKIVRVGGQSKNEKLKNYNIVNQRRHFEHERAVHETRIEVRNFMERQAQLMDTLNKIEENESILDFDCFKSVIENYYETWFAKAKPDDVRRWLMEGKNRDARNAVNITQVVEDVDNMQLIDNPHEEEVEEEIEFDDILNNVLVVRNEPLISLQQLRKKIYILQRDLSKLQGELYSLSNTLRQEEFLTEIWETETDFYYLMAQLQFYQNPRTRVQPVEYDLSNPFRMKYSDRWQLYFFWLDMYTAQVRRRYTELGVDFRKLYQIYNDMRAMEDTQLMKKHLVVGMTTTGAARLQSTLQALKSPIVIVEEAAEILEGHIVAALTNHCQHLILIGDHLQLKPSAADYKIETKFKLGISLFERMVKNDIKCHTLNVQHRMRPEISNLVKPHIYPMLEDHESVMQREPIKGIDKCLYFIDHQEPEEVCQDSSKRNTHESKFLIGLARHLILNGYEAEQITILAAYLGQFFEMRREVNRDDNRLLLQDVRISVLDNYQGEESDIILLSLVRSNNENKAGFLKNQNRVCVALSRAKYGLYVIGNMSLLLQANSENQIWEKVKAVLEEQNAIGPQLTLKCQIHPYKITHVSKGQDFITISEGGCDLMCEMLLACEHKCKRLCHVQDRSHSMYKCNEECLKPLCNDDAHVCRKLCYQECGPCTYPVMRDLACGHRISLQCHIDANKHNCVVPVSVKLPCDHQTDIPCSADPVTFKCPFPCDSRVEPCGHACTRTCHIRFDPDHLKYRCMELCEKPRLGCRLKEDNKHTCTRLCFEDCEECNAEMKSVRSCGHVFNRPCKVNVEELECTKPCKKILPCEHPCKRKCFETCGQFQCEFVVEKIIPECNHKVRMKCSQEPRREFCKKQTCPRLLPCGHKCKNPCGKPCSTDCEEIVNCNISTPCGHTVTKILCRLKNSVDLKTLLEHCNEPCGVTLKCNHKCSGTCGECRQSRIHKRCQEKCGVPLVCNHECQLPCREACKPCTRDCEMRCGHNKCKKKCGEPCTPCRNPCLRRCPHLICTLKCGQICNVPPCYENCRKRLKCGHPCVGFCGDPCPPLCKICDEEELTDIFFGTEDEEDAIFVLLRDCGHVLEHNGLENWLNGGGNQIQFKTCPKCKTSITTTERYSDYVKRAMWDVILAKKTSFGHPRQNEATRERLLQELDALEPSFEKFHSTGILSIFSKLKPRLLPVRNQRRQPINKIELNAIQSKIQTLTYIIKCFDTTKPFFEILSTEIKSHLKMLLNVLTRYEDHTTDQESEDLECEIKRLYRMIQLREIEMSPEFRMCRTNPDVQSLLKNTNEKLCKEERFTVMLDEAVKESLKDLATKVNSTILINDKERMEIVAAIGMTKGHWYKCPNGHPYVIGECGGANQVAKCPCGEAIGGTSHHLLRTNALAGEMDGATSSAWPGGLY